MERAMSVEERIRRAEDIYNRRNGVYTKTSSGVYTKNSTNETKTKNTSKIRTVKRLLMQIFVCLSIYVIFYAVTNREYIFSDDFRNSVNTFFTETVNITKIYTKVKNDVLSLFEDEEKQGKTQENQEAQQSKTQENQEGQQGQTQESEQNQTQDNEHQQGNNDKDTNEQSKVSKDEDIGGAEESAEEVAKVSSIGGAEESTEEIATEKNDAASRKSSEDTNQKKDEELTEQELMERDAKEIKKKISFIVPVKGRISSSFGWRNPTTSTVPKYHTGVDIAATQGTKIKSATDGKVIMASSAGDYGNHYQIQTQDVIIIYAHCQKLYLKEGDTVKQGQEIGEVGSTGNSTGPHLHFEVRFNGRKIDPQLILDL